MNSISTTSLNSGQRMPVIGLGTWQLDHDAANAVVHALGLGYRMVDTAGDYDTQPAIGAALRRSGVPRREVFLVTKVEEDEDAYDAVRRNLGELEQDYADLVLIHRPPADAADRRQSWSGLLRARHDGLATDIGVSNYSAAQIGEIIDTFGDAPAVDQVEWSPFGHSAELLDYCLHRGIVVQAYSPLTRTERLGDPLLAEVAEACQRTPAQVLLRWNLQHGVVPLPKANRREHQRENLAIFDFAIPDSQLQRLDAANERYSALGDLPYR